MAAKTEAEVQELLDRHLTSVQALIAKGLDPRIPREPPGVAKDSVARNNEYKTRLAMMRDLAEGN